MEPYIGQIMMFGGNFAIRGWATCDGQLIPISQNTALFSIIGTTYGGDGRVTFGLPDLRGRVAIHQGNGPGLSSYAWGQIGGAETVTLTTPQIPSHNHMSVLKASATNATIGTPTGGSSLATPGALSGRTFTGTLGYDSAVPAVDLNAASIAVGNAGGNQFHTNMQPFLCVSHQIALVGIFPSRS